MPKKLSDKIKQERINFLRKLAKTKKYTRADLIKLFQEKYGVLIRENFLREALGGMKLPSGQGLATAAKQSEAKSKYLKNYTYEDLERDIRSGKTRTEIVDDILKKNPSDVKDIRRLTLSALKSRIIKRPELEKIEQQFLKQNIKNSKSALNDIKNFIDKNKEAYKKVYASNKIGAVDNFKEKVLDYASQKYPNFVKRSKGGRDILTGQRIFEPYGMFRELQQRGDVGREIGIKRDIRKALDIPERAPIGEATTQRLNRNYNSALTKLLKEAQEKNLIPKIDPITKNPIKDADGYYRYINRTQIDPIRNLFGRNFNFGQEHLGGISRALVINDPITLTKITAMDPIQNKFVKGPNFDTKVSSLIKLAKQSSPEKAKEYVASANEIIKEANKKFGLDGSTYKVKGEEIITIQPKATLEDSLYKKAQRAIKTFVATERFKDPQFKNLSEPLQKAVNAAKQGNEVLSNKFLKNAIKLGGKGAVLGLIGVSGLKIADAAFTPLEAAEPETPIKYNDEIGAFVDPKTDDKVSQATLLDWAANNPMPTAAVASAPLLSKTVRKGAGKLLSGLLKTLGSPTAAAGFAGLTIKENLEEGKSIPDAVIDPLVGVELLFPELAKRAATSPTGTGLLSKAGRFLLNPIPRAAAAMTPLGVGITALGLGKMGIKAAIDEREKILGMTEQEKTDYLADQYESFGGVFGEGA